MPGHDVDHEVIRRFRAGEPIEGMHRDRLLLLLTTGRRSGEERTTPMMFVLDDGEPVVVASDDGAARQPDRLLNARSHPDARVELPDGTSRHGSAEELTGDARAGVRADLVARFPVFAEHQQRAGARTIPLLKLHLAD